MEKEMIVDLEGLKKFAGELAKKLKGDEVIALIGDLGSGKTTFTRFLVEALEPLEDIPVRSPTFAVLNEYPTKKGTVYHADLYRVKNFDFTDYEGNGILIVEWADLQKNLNPDIVIEFYPTEDENKRKLVVRDFREKKHP
jgi:tRNA threonylcarbamoyladenosine biosynthesis protein TsaE